MKLFTKEQVESLLEIIDFQTGVFISTQMGESVLSTQDKYILNKYGFDQKSIKKIPPYFQSFIWGRLSSWLDENQANKMVYSDFLDYMHSNSFIPLSRREQDMYDIAINRSYSHIKNLGNTRKVKLSSLIDEEDIRREMTGAINNRESLSTIVSNWGHQTNNWNRDYGRIAETEMNSIFQLGRMMAIERSHGTEAKVYKTVYKLACRHCIRLYLTNGIGSQPILFTVAQLVANGSNIGRKVVDWKAVVESTHPFCFNSDSVRITTVNGYKKIKDVVVGDLVLTHKNRFKKVTNLITSKIDEKEEIKSLNIVYKIKSIKNGYITQELRRITQNHPIYTSKGWINAGDIKIGDFIYAKSVKCENCDNQIPLIYRSRNELNSHCFSCSQIISGLKQWKDEEMRSKMCIEISKGNLKRFKNSTIEQRREVTKKARKKLDELYPNERPWMEETLKKSNKTNGKRKTFIERKLHYFLTQLGIDFDINHYIKNNGNFLNNVKGYFPDISIHKLKIIIEADGDKWHQNSKKYDTNRDLDIKNNIGYDTFRFKEKDILNNGNKVYSELKNIIKNHSGYFENLECEVVSIEKNYNLNHFIGEKLYNFSVEEDESYVADGIVVHNCRCNLSYVMDGYKWDKEKKDFVPSSDWKRKVERKSKVKINWGDKIMEV